MKQLSSTEWTLIWSSLRYFVGRRTIAAATYPGDIIKTYYGQLNQSQKANLVRDIDAHVRQGHSLGDDQIDAPHWLKFRAALDEQTHQRVELTDGSQVTIFRANDRYYPLTEYLASPQREIFLTDKHIRAFEEGSTAGKAIMPLGQV